MYAALAVDCSCDDKNRQNADDADTSLQIALAASDMGDVTKAVAGLLKAQNLCDCSGCGCN